VRDKLQTAPWWVLSLIQGVFFGTATTVINHLQHPGSGWKGAILGGLVGGVFFGAVMGPLIVRAGRRALAAAGNVPARTLRVAARAVNRGHPPLDPETRHAAELLATYQLKQLARSRGLSLVLFGFFGVVSVVVALTSSPWWWIAVSIHAAFFGLYLVGPRHLQRRIEILKSGTDDPVIVP